MVTDYPSGDGEDPRPAEAAEVDTVAQCRLRSTGSGAVAAILEAVPDAALVLAPTGELIHANAHALRLLDQVGIEGAIGLDVGALLGCERVEGGWAPGPAGDNGEFLAALEAARAQQEATAFEATLSVEQGGLLFTGHFRVRVAPVPCDGLRCSLVLLAGVGPLRRRRHA